MSNDDGMMLNIVTNLSPSNSKFQSIKPEVNEKKSKTDIKKMKYSAKMKARSNFSRGKTHRDDRNNKMTMLERITGSELKATEE